MTTLNSLPEQGVVAVVGCQWGDEGKGKIVDVLAEWADMVARGTGGANAGHTIVVDGTQHVFHLTPSAILRDADGLQTVIGRGVAFDPECMLKELDMLDQLGVSHEHLRVSREARLVLPHHKVLDRLREAQAGDGKIGTTGRGIGPAYSDHVARLGLKVVDLLNPDDFKAKLTRCLKPKWAELDIAKEQVRSVMEADPTLASYWCNEEYVSLEAVLQAYTRYGAALRRYICDTDALVRKTVAGGQRVLLEGAQAALLSIEHGLYPMVTASDCTIAGLAAGVGLSESQVTKTIGVVKGPAMTRVGSGVFPTELGPAEDAEFPKAKVNSINPAEQCVALRQVGHEYGATTGRPRRIGWLDLPLLRLAIRTGIDELILTKIDMLDRCGSIKICTHYTHRGAPYDLGDRILQPGERVDIAYGDDALMQHMEPVYVTFLGWHTSLSDFRAASELPANLTNLIRYIENEVGRKISAISVGPEREQTIAL